MSFQRLRAALAALPICLVALAGCGDDGSGPPRVKTDAELRFLTQALDAPPLSATVKSFVAVKGQDTEVRLYYRPRPGVADSAEFLRFRLEDESLLASPLGVAYRDGESVLITITVPDPTKFVVNMEPAGLRFSPGAPARLKWKLGEADDDFDDDGDRDDDDARVVSQLRVWRQQAAGLPWAQLATRFEVQLYEIEADLVGFSNFAVAY